MECHSDAQNGVNLEPLNGPLEDHSRRSLLHQLFEEQVERTPTAVAVIYEGESLTYERLNARANQLARYLRDQGVRPDDLVGICLERGLEMAVGLLGILKAGGAYLPLDPSYPRERVQYMLEDAAPRILLTQARLKDRLPETAARLIALDETWTEIAEQSTSNPEASAIGLSAHHLAYVIYTSGSTGRPKGVMIEHRNVTRLFAATDRWFGFNQRDVWTLCHSFAFDFSVWELWGALLYGGRVIIVPHDTTRSPHELYRLIRDNGVTVLSQTPSAFAQLIEAQAQSPRKQHDLRVVVFGGEALELRTLRPWVEHNGVNRPLLVNMYGITETTVHVTYRPLSRQDIERDSGSLIGKPIPDLRIYVLDQQRQPMPIAEPGEIYVSGAGVARGYLNQPERTAERFTSDPFGNDPQARMYKTGDVARWRSDGTLEYLGRNDHQVKIRGFRIELGEIEAQLARHPSVRQAVVIVREDALAEKRLVAYVTTQTHPLAEMSGGTARASSVEELRAHLRSVLPDHMVPAALVVMESFPLTHNGKLDRDALPEPPKRPAELGEYVSPQGDLQHILAGIWARVLAVDPLGVRDNFFQLGGNSMHAMRLIARVIESLAVELSIIEVLEHPTVETLARHIESMRATACAVGTESVEQDEGVV